MVEPFRRFDVAAQRVQIWASRTHLIEPDLLAGIKLFGAAADPTGDVADLRRGLDGGRCRLAFEGDQVGVDGGVAAAETLRGDFAVQLCDVGAASFQPWCR
ncbi:hypothetical protein [Nonomuraea jabiensis]|uniref:Uncharacterized protein n=1 Tax=Nonomuraea jabiensis TaxID=882448 RepID=A0A7W9L7S6_9ACTN|nr:hypothetical protein [Nonomuraea jabiensis]MBB5773755.1 hypothetical protein [Nonomuraea jabiensis]